LTLIPLGRPCEEPPRWHVERCASIEDARHKWPKTPRIKWQQYQDAPPSDETFEGWRAQWPNANWAILTGAQLVVVDADSAEAIAWIEGGGITRTPRTVDTAKGTHYWFRGDASIRNSAGKARIDIRGAGGYVVAPGSVHESGVVYHESNPGDFDIDQLPALTPADLQAIAAYNGTTAPAANGTGNLNFTARPAPLEAGGADEGGRSDHLIRFAGACVEEALRLGYSLERARLMVVGENEQNRPPLPAAEVEGIWQSALRMDRRNHPDRHSPAVEHTNGTEAAQPESPAVAPRAPRFRRVDLRTATPHQARMAMDPILPIGAVTLFASDGGGGKSNLALVIAAHVATGRPWAGMEVDQGTVAFASLEDDANVVSWRLQRIAQAYGLPEDELHDNLHVLDGTEFDAALAAEQTQAGVRVLQLTTTFDELDQAVAGARLIIIDNASDAFAGDEISRRQVRAFMRALTQMARRHDAAVLLLAHVDKAAARHGSHGASYSGSTAWNNSARSRLALLPPNNDRPDIELVHEKANHTARANPIFLHWQSGVLVPVTRGGIIESIRTRTDEDALLAALTAATSAGAKVSAATSGPCTFAHDLEGYVAFDVFTGPAGRKRAKRALVSLMAQGRVSRVEYLNEHRHARSRLEVVRTDADDRPQQEAEQ
jgi:hypothetical protein